MSYSHILRTGLHLILAAFALVFVHATTKPLNRFESREEEALREKILILAATIYGALFVLRAEDLFHHEEELVDEKPVDDTLRRGMWAVQYSRSRRRVLGLSELGRSVFPPLFATHSRLGADTLLPLLDSSNDSTPCHVFRLDPSRSRFGEEIFTARPVVHDDLALPRIPPPPPHLQTSPRDRRFERQGYRGQHRTPGKVGVGAPPRRRRIRQVPGALIHGGTKGRLLRDRILPFSARLQLGLLGALPCKALRVQNR